MILKDFSDDAILKEIGERIARYRLNKNMTQQELSVEAGVSRPTVQRAESGYSIQVLKFIRILRALGLLENFDSLIPNPSVSPVQQVKMRGKIRQRASSASPQQGNNSVWSWGDES